MLLIQKERMHRGDQKRQVVWDKTSIVLEGHFYFKEYQITHLTGLEDKL